MARLVDELLDAERGGFGDAHHVALIGNQDDRSGVSAMDLQLAQELEPVEAIEGGVEQRERERTPVELRERLVHRGGGCHLVAEALQRPLEMLSGPGVSLDDQRVASGRCRWT